MSSVSARLFDRWVVQSAKTHLSRRASQAKVWLFCFGMNPMFVVFYWLVRQLDHLSFGCASRIYVQ